MPEDRLGGRARLEAKWHVYIMFSSFGSNSSSGAPSIPRQVLCPVRLTALFLAAVPVHAPIARIV